MNRLLVPRIAVLLMFAILIGRLYQLQLVDTEVSRLQSQAEQQYTRTLPVRPLRGEIFAGDGTTLLAESVPIYTVAIRPADLDRAAPAGSSERTEMFARLSQLLGITSTLTISPATALEDDPILAGDLQQGLGAETVARAQRHTVEMPLSIPITPNQSAGVVALLQQYGDIMQYEMPEAPAVSRPALGAALAELGGALEIGGTLTISPATRLQTEDALRSDVERLLGRAALDAAGAPHARTWATIEAPAQRSMDAFKISRAYSTTVSLSNEIAERVAKADIPGYQTLQIQANIPRDVALVLRENAADLPGVVVELDYQRRYPLSASMPSLSHMLGYIGRIGKCELAIENPARSWLAGMLDSIGHTTHCNGFVDKQIDSANGGRARYLADNDRIGKDGLEASYEAVLRGQLGSEKLIVDVMNRPVREPEVIEEARDGHNLVLTIDVGFQRQVEQIMKNWIDHGENLRKAQTGKFAWKQRYQPIRAGVAIVSEVQTGRILAMVSWPSYDNNIWVDPARRSELSNYYPEDPAARKEMELLSPLVNRAISGQYPPGSTIKQFDAAIALQKGVISPQTQIFDPGRLVVQNEYNPQDSLTFPNAGFRAYNNITVSDALKVSSNVFFMSVIGGNSENIRNLRDDQKIIPRGLPINEFADGLHWFGLGEPTGIPLVGEKSGRVPTPQWMMQAQQRTWTTGDTYNASIGQGNVLVTPLQLLMGASAVANNGTLYQPQLVKEIRRADGTLVEEVAPQVLRQAPVDPAYFAVVREGMRRSVTEGVNVAARDECSGLQISGKTGTAEFGPEIIPGDNLTRQTHSWFVGFAPYDNPQIQVVVLSEGTGSLGDGSAFIAVPAVTQIMQAYFGVTPPNPLPSVCQSDLPPLPTRTNPSAPPPMMPQSRFGQ
jgi:penicillin-binding protein 2